MIIHWYGHACFKFQSSQQATTLVIDPFDASLGWRAMRAQAAIGVISTQRSEYAYSDGFKSADEDKKLFLVQYPGEYEIGGVFIRTIPIEQEGGVTMLSVIRMDDITTLHTGALRGKVDPKVLEDIGEIDILCVGIGGLDVLNAQGASELAAALEPRIIIPMIYKMPGLKKSYDTPDRFLKEYGVKDVQPLDKLKILRKDLPADKTELVLLNPA